MKRAPREKTNLANRSAREVLDDHLRLAAENDFPTDFERNFDDDIVLMTGYGLYRGLDGLRKKARLLGEQMPGGQWTYHNVMVDEELGFLEWTGVADNGNRIFDGADSYLIRDGKIRKMTIHYTVVPPDA